MSSCARLGTSKFKFFQLCFQSSLQFSLKVLVLYRSQAHVQLYIELTTYFALHSQEVLLPQDCHTQAEHVLHGTFTLAAISFQKHAHPPLANYNYMLKNPNCKHKHIIIHAQLLHNSHLGFCPLPTFMLKFSRSLHSNPHTQHTQVTPTMYNSNCASRLFASQHDVDAKLYTSKIQCMQCMNLAIS